MTIEEIAGLLDTIGLPYAYHHFSEGEAPDLPYMIYTYPESIPYPADGRVYVQGTRVQLELYSEIRDLAVEGQIEAVLDARDLIYRKSEVYIESEHLYEIIYEMEVAVMG